MNKTYKHGEVEYGYSKSFRKWLFKNGDLSVVQKCEGFEQASKVASVVAGALKRNHKNGAVLDGMARAQISRITLN